MRQTFKNIQVSVKLFPNDFDGLAVYEGYEELYCFNWGENQCYEYDENNFFTISNRDITTLEDARLLIEKFNDDFGLEWGVDRFNLDCISLIKL